MYADVADMAAENIFRHPYCWVIGEFFISLGGFGAVAAAGLRLKVLGGKANFVLFTGKIMKVPFQSGNVSAVFKQGKIARVGEGEGYLLSLHVDLLGLLKILRHPSFFAVQLFEKSRPPRINMFWFRCRLGEL